MPGEKLKLWRDSIKEYCDKKGCSYKVPRKGTKEYASIKKIYSHKAKGM